PARVRAVRAPARVSALARGARRRAGPGLMDSGPLVLILFAVVVVLSALALWRVGGRLKGLDANRQPSPGPSLLLLQREIEAARNEVRQAQSETLAAVRRELAQFSVQMNAQLGQVGSGVQQQLKHVGQVVGAGQGSLGKLGEVTQRVFDIGKDIAGLEQILRSPKMRGGLGESFLEGLLAQMLPREHFALQHVFATGDRVDAVVKIGGRLVPVDAKFPLENFRRMLEETEEERRRPLRRAFGRGS